MNLAARPKASPVDGAGCGVEVGIAFPFLAAPPVPVLRGEAPLSHGLRESALRAPHEALAGAVLRHLPGAAPSRVYVGSETCERLVPSPEGLGAWLSAAAESGWGVSLVLPPLGRQGQGRALACLPALARVPGAEVVANDWGTVHAARTRFPELPVVLGRLTHKMLRDPRLADYFDSPEAPLAARSALCGSGELAPGFRALVERYGIGRREIDPYLQPLEEREWEDGPGKLSVHLPYLFVTMGRSCLPGAMGRDRADKFVPGGPCGDECRRHAIEFRLPDPGGPGPGKSLLALGNALYHPVSPRVTERILGALPVHRRVDRVVVTLPVTESAPC